MTSILQVLKIAFCVGTSDFSECGNDCLIDPQSCQNSKRKNRFFRKKNCTAEASKREIQLWSKAHGLKKVH